MTRGQGSVDLSGRSVLISGGAGALGREIVATLSAAGARVVVNDVVPPDALGARSDDDVAGYVRADAAQAGEARRLLDRCTEILGGLPDVVCCHAGIVRSSPILEQDLADVEETLRTNVTAPFALAQEASRRWVEASTPGRLIFTGSWVQDVPWPGVAAYIASKAALRAMARSFARELAPHRIRANVVAPGIVGAGMAKQQWDTEPDYRARATRAIPLGALQEPQSVADTFLFLVSDLASYMTGATLLVDGGASLYPMDDDE